MTLKQLKVFTHPEGYPQLLAFSPECHLLTWVGYQQGPFITWDLQTGIQVSQIIMEERSYVPQAHSITYSGCGTMFGVLFGDIDDRTTAIGTYDILSNKCICYHPVKVPVKRTIWTHGEYIQFVSPGPGPPAIWEVGFTSEHPPTEVESLPIPNDFNPLEKFFLFSTLSRLAYVLGNTILVWDTQCSKLLLDSGDIGGIWNMTFSSDGHFFAHEVNPTTSGSPEVYLWKESPTGYILHQRFVTIGAIYSDCGLHFSPNGQSIVLANGPNLQLWHTTDSIPSPSSSPTKPFQGIEGFIVEFSLDRSLVVTA